MNLLLHALGVVQLYHIRLGKLDRLNTRRSLLGGGGLRLLLLLGDSSGHASQVEGFLLLPRDPRVEQGVAPGAHVPEYQGNARRGLVQPYLLLQNWIKHFLEP